MPAGRRTAAPRSGLLRRTVVRVGGVVALTVASFGVIGGLNAGIHPADAVIQTSHAPSAPGGPPSASGGVPSAAGGARSAAADGPTAAAGAPSGGIGAPSGGVGAPSAAAGAPSVPAARPATPAPPAPAPGPTAANSATPAPPATPAALASTHPASPAPAPAPQSGPSHPGPAAPSAPASPAALGFGCGSALAYLAGHAAPGFTFECPGSAAGHQAMTCINVAGLCAGQRLIAIAKPCPAAYENEASNSWVLLGLRHAVIDPYGACP